MADPQHAHAFVFDYGEKNVTVYCDGDAGHRLPVPAPGQTYTRPCNGCGVAITLTGPPQVEAAGG